MLSVTSDGSELLAVLAESIELIVECCLNLLARDVRELGLGDQRLGFGADKLLFEDNDSGRVGLLVF